MPTSYESSTANDDRGAFQSDLDAKNPEAAALKKALMDSGLSEKEALQKMMGPGAKASDLAYASQGLQHGTATPEAKRATPSADFGGYRGGAADYSNFIKNSADENDGLQRQTQNTANYAFGQMQNGGSNAPQARENAVLSAQDSASRAGQNDALGLMASAANGGAPSAAARQTDRDMGALMGQQAGAMGAARGLSALNGAGLGGSAVAQAAGGLAGSGATARSTEIQQAMGQYGQMAGDTRGADQNRLGINSNMAMQNAQNRDNYALGWGQQAVNAGKLGNSLELSDQSAYGASLQPIETQFGYDQGSQAWANGADADMTQLQYAKNADKRKSQEDLYMGIGGSLVTAFGSAAAKTGAAAADKAGGR